MSCIKGSNPFVSANKTSHLLGGFFVLSNRFARHFIQEFLCLMVLMPNALLRRTSCIYEHDDL